MLKVFPLKGTKTERQQVFNLLPFSYPQIAVSDDSLIHGKLQKNSFQPVMS